MDKKEKAANLKNSWMQMPDEFFETKTFADLVEGESFICLPQPGDNDGHGGFLKPHRVCKKDFSGQFPDSMPVLQVLL